MNGIMKIVSIRSRLDSSMRVERIAGTVQPKPTRSGTNDFPGSPKARMKRSARNAARAM